MGIAEAGVFPGCKLISHHSASFVHSTKMKEGFYLLSMWYKREEAQRRFSFFVNAATFAGAFGGLLATGIGHMDGIRGYNAWRWIFILEGLATCLLSFLAFFVVSDFPENAHWLSEAERAFVIKRMAEDQGKSDVEERITAKGVLESLLDIKVILAGFMYFGPTMSAYSRSPPLS